MNETETIVEPTKAEIKMLCERAALDKREADIQTVRRFLDLHGDKLTDTDWQEQAWSCRIKIGANKEYSEMPVKNAREIARRFPGVVWTRVKNNITCGVIDFQGSLDGVELLIENAETLKFKDGELVSL